jgi:hypothetical protein
MGVKAKIQNFADCCYWNNLAGFSDQTVCIGESRAGVYLVDYGCVYWKGE